MLAFGCKLEIRSESSAIDSPKVTIDTVKLSPSRSLPVEGATSGDVAVQEDSYRAEEIIPIRNNFNRINKITKWTSIKTRDLAKSIELGEATYYYLNDTLEKIVEHNYGEMRQWLTEYYLADGKLSFVFEKEYQYNRLFYDPAFNFDSSYVVSIRNYFTRGILFHQLHSEDCGAPWAQEYLRKEHKRLTSDYEELLKLVDE